MSRKLKRILCVLCLVMVLGTGAAMAQLGAIGGILFGAGMPVFDLSAAMNFATQIIQTAQQIAETIKILSTAKEHLSQAYYQAKYLHNQFKYLTQTVPWHPYTAADTFGWNNAWVTAANTGQGAVMAWGRATMPTTFYSSSLLPASQAQRAEKQMATLELLAGTGATTLDTVGRIRANGPGMDGTIQSLEKDTLSDDPDMNTEAAQLNKGNAIALAHLKATSDANKVAIANAELALIQMKLQHDAMASALEAEAAFRMHGPAALTAQHSNAGGQIMAYRIP